MCFLKKMIFSVKMKYIVCDTRENKMHYFRILAPNIANLDIVSNDIQQIKRIFGDLDIKIAYIAM